MDKVNYVYFRYLNLNEATSIE